MTGEELFRNILSKKSFLCVGLDTDPTKIPSHIKKEAKAIFKFNKEIIDHTQDLAIAFKPNIAFYEAQGIAGWEALHDTVHYIRKKYPNLFIIADAKRGDIGNSSHMYAKAFLDKMNFDAITVTPYMGEDSVKPFLEYRNKWAILLALTSNKGADDFQNFYDSFTHQYYYERVLSISKDWGNTDNMMYVVGATQAKSLVEIRKIIPEHFLLIPGIGAQGGSLQEVAALGMNNHCGLIVNSSRSIIYAGKGKKFEKDARNAARNIQEEMQILLEHYF